MTPAQRIRKAALGPAPRHPHHVRFWTRDHALAVEVMKNMEMMADYWLFFEANNTERRIFLLFVAEALENE